MDKLTPASIAKHLMKLQFTQDYLREGLLHEADVKYLIEIEFGIDPSLKEYKSEAFVNQVHKLLTTPKKH